MKRCWRNGVGDLAPGVVLPGTYQQKLRDRLADVDEATSAINTECARQRAVGVIEGLELAGALDSARIERLYLLVEQVATARLLELESHQG